MKTFNFLTLSLVFALLAFSTKAQQQPSDSGTCTQFNWDQSPAYVSFTDDAIQASAAGNCRDHPRPCPLTARGESLFEASSNISSLFRGLTGIKQFWDSVASATQNEVSKMSTTPGSIPTFNTSVIATMDQTMMLDPGQTAYMTFDMLQVCYTGTTGNCTGDIRNDTPIEVCAPVWNNRHDTDGPSRVSGRYDLVNISAQDEAKFLNPLSTTNNAYTGSASTVGYNFVAFIVPMALMTAML